MLRIAYVENEEIHKLCFNHQFPNLKYDYYEDPYSLLKAVKNGLEYDLIITDKKLGNYDSVENHLVDTLRQAGFKPRLWGYVLAIGAFAILDNAIVYT